MGKLKSRLVWYRQPVNGGTGPAMKEEGGPPMDSSAATRRSIASVPSSARLVKKDASSMLIWSSSRSNPVETVNAMCCAAGRRPRSPRHCRDGLPGEPTLPAASDPPLSGAMLLQSGVGGGASSSSNSSESSGRIGPLSLPTSSWGRGMETVPPAAQPQAPAARVGRSSPAGRVPIIIY
eukprot:scaffold28342_cov123-Isochrysis_galbana.AAC.3